MEVSSLLCAYGDISTLRRQQHEITRTRGHNRLIYEPVSQPFRSRLTLRKIVFSHAANQPAHVVTEPNEAAFLCKHK